MSSNIAPDRPPVGAERRPSEDSRHREWTGFGRRRRSPLRLALSLGLAAAAIILLYTSQPGWFAAPVAVVAPRIPTHPTPAPQPSPTPKPQVRDPFIGGAQVDSIHGVRITLLGVHYTYGSGADQANKGNVYAVVRLRFENHSGSDYPLVPNINCQLPLSCYFYVNDSQGEKNPPLPYDPTHTRLRAVILQDKGYEEGSYTFEVPDRDRFNRSQPLQLLYYPNPLTAADTIYRWILQERTRR